MVPVKGCFVFPISKHYTNLKLLLFTRCRETYFRTLYDFTESPLGSPAGVMVSLNSQQPEKSPDDFYTLGLNLGDKLPWPHKFSTEELFFMFYTATGDALQVLAGKFLYNKGWRYSKTGQKWIARFPHQPPDKRTDTYETGLYQVFDVDLFKAVPRRLTLVYEDLADDVGVVNMEDMDLAQALTVKLAEQKKSNSFKFV